MAEPRHARRDATTVMSALMVVLGVAIVIRTVAAGGSPLSVGLLLGVDTDGAAVLGCVLVLLAGLGYAVGAAWTARRFPDVPRLGLLTGVLVASSLLLVPPVLLDPPTRVPSLQGVAAIAVLGLVGTGLAFVVMYWLIAEVGPERTTLVTYLAPVFAVAYGTLLLDEELSALGVGGLVLVVAGAYLAGRRGPRTAAAPVPDLVTSRQG